MVHCYPAGWTIKGWPTASAFLFTGSEPERLLTLDVERPGYTVTSARVCLTHTETTNGKRSQQSDADEWTNWSFPRVKTALSLVSTFSLTKPCESHMTRANRASLLLCLETTGEQAARTTVLWNNTGQLNAGLQLDFKIPAHSCKGRLRAFIVLFSVCLDLFITLAVLAC